MLPENILIMKFKSPLPIVQCFKDDIYGIKLGCNRWNVIYLIIY